MSKFDWTCISTEIDSDSDSEIAFTGTIHIENSKIVNSNITISSTYAKKIINDYIKPIPKAIINPQNVSYSYYNYIDGE